MSKKLRRGEDGAINANKANGAFEVSYTIGDEAADTINVAGQLLDKNGDAHQEITVVDLMLSDSPSGVGIAATAPSGVVAGTDGLILDATVADKLLKIQTDVDGKFDIDIIEDGADTWYAASIIKGEQSVSDEITFV